MTRSRFLALGAVALLAACGDKNAPAEGSLQGEVLEGTISDAMVPLDQVKSQAPLAESTGGAGSSGTAVADDEPASQADEVDAEQPTPTPAETPVTTIDGQAG